MAEQKGLVRSGIVVSTMTMISRVLGLIRDVVLARVIGDTPAADAFYVAIKIPNFLRRLFAEGAFSQAFVPVLAEYRERGNFAALKLFVDRVCGFLGLSVVGLSIVVVFFAPQVMIVFAPGFVDEPEKFALAAEFLRITFPYLALISLTGFAGAILNSFDRFAIPAITPVFLNLSLIGAALWLAPLFDEPAFALAWGVLIAGAVQLVFQLPFLAQINLLPTPRVKKDSGVSKVLRLMIPALFGVSVSQINLLFDTIIASFLPGGSVSWLYYSDRLAELPLGVFGVALATVVLPTLSRKHARGAGELFSETLKWASRMVFFIGLPAAVALIILAEPLIFTLFGYGQLSDRGVFMSAWALRAYALGLLAFMWIKVLATGYFAQQDTKTPVKIGIIAMIVNMAFNVIFVWWLYDKELGHVGLALATAASAWLNAGLLLLGLKRRQVILPSSLKWVSLVPVVSTILMGVALQFAVWQLNLNWVMADFATRAMHLTWLVVLGLAIYTACIPLLGWRKAQFVSPK